MTITKMKGISNGGAYLVSRTSKSVSGSSTLDSTSSTSSNSACRVLVSFNTRDELELKFKFEGEKESMKETYKIEEIVECYSGDLKDFNTTLVIDVFKNQNREEIVLRFDDEQEFRRTLFTYKYFKMRNRLTSSSSGESSSEGSSSPSLSTKSRTSAEYAEIPNYVKGFEYPSSRHQQHYIKKYEEEPSYAFKSLDYSPSQKIKLSLIEQKENIDTNIDAKSSKSTKLEYDLMQVTDNNGVTHMSVESKTDVGEIDGLIYTDVDYDSVDFANSSSSDAVDAPKKPQRRRQMMKRFKGKAPPPPTISGSEAVHEGVKGHVIRTGAEKQDKHASKEGTNFTSRTTPPITKGLNNSSNGYESDREEWRSRSTFSSSAFHSLARPARRALAAYYRLSSIPTQPTNVSSVSQTNTMRKPSPRNPKNLQTLDYPKNYQSMHPEYIIITPMHPIENKRNSLPPTVHQKVDLSKQEYRYGKMLFNRDYKRNPLSGSMTYLNISNRLYGLTDKLKELGHQNKQQTWQPKVDKDKKEKGLLKPVIKKNTTNSEGSKRPVVRTCSNEPPKKVTFSAFATVQVV